VPNIPYKMIGVPEFIFQNGEPATWIEFERGPENQHGDASWVEKKTEISVIQSFQTSTKVPVKINSEAGQFTSYDYEFFTTDILNVDVRAVGKRPELVHRGRRHFVDETQTAPIGIMRIVCSQRRS
jgi:hypothetical protein